MTWTVLAVDAECGACRGLIRALDPVALFTERRLLRCAACAGVPVDDATIDLARFHLERDALQADGRGPTRAPLVRVRPRPLQFAAVGALPFDPKTAAANDRD